MWPSGQFSMIFDGSFVSFQISHQFSILFNGNFTFSLYSGQFSMLFNGKFAFCQFSMLFNGNLRIDSFGGGRMDVRTDVWKFTPVSYRTSALWGRCPLNRLTKHLGRSSNAKTARKRRKKLTRTDRPTDRPTDIAGQSRVARD